MAAYPDTFLGYRRTDGSAGIRNHLLVVPSVICANTVAQRVASLIPGAVAVPHPHGCAQVGDDVTLTEKVLAGAAANPNVGAALVIGLGCETCQSTDVAELTRALAPGKPVESYSIQDAGGSIKAISRGVEAGKRLMAGIAAQRRVEVPVSELTLAAGCGEVDQTTERAANPALDAVAQLLVDAGGTVVSSPPLPPLAGTGAPARLAFAERPQGRGRFLMDAPAQDAVALTAKAVAGAQVCLFATGGGSPLGNAILPVIKVCANAATIAKMEDNVDFSAVSLAEGSEDKADLAGRLFRMLLDVCNGQLTNAEIIGHQEFAIHRVGPTV
jgi:altronate dehydratase